MLQPFSEGKAVVQLVLPPSWIARINRLAMERGVNRSALIREAIRATYFREHEGEERSPNGQEGEDEQEQDSHPRRR